MTYEISIQEVPSHYLAVAQAQCTLPELSAKIAKLLPEVWTFLQFSGVKSTGLNVVMYLEETRGHLMTNGTAINVGVQVLAPFHSHPPVFFSSTPPGKVATATHIGSYDHLPNAHAAIRQWCQENHRPIEGTNWEIYAHWNPDPAQQRTDIFYLLK